MRTMIVRLAAPALVALGTAGLAGGLVAGPAGASSKPKPKPAATAKAKAATKAGVVDLRGVIVTIDAAKGQLKLRVGKHDILVKATAAELKAVKVGEQVTVHGKIVHAARVATSITKA